MEFPFIRILIAEMVAITLTRAQITTQNILCYDRAQVYGTTCFHVGQDEVTWKEAYDFCHQRRGWLANRVDDLTPLPPKVFFGNGILQIWSGHHIKDNRLLEDHLPTVEPVYSTANINFNSSTVAGSNCLVLVYREQCVTTANASLLCSPTFVEDFVSCDERHTFLCRFEAQSALSINILNGGGVQLMRQDIFPVDLYIANGTSNSAGADQVCEDTLQNGRAYRFKDKQTLTMFFSNANIDFMYYFNDQIASKTLWVNSEDARCTSIVWPEAPPPNIQGITWQVQGVQVFTWPCNNSQLVLCEVDKVYSASRAPTIDIQIDGSLITVVSNEIQAPSQVVRDMASNYQNTGIENFTMTCNPGIVQEKLQKMALYKNFIPFLTNQDVGIFEWSLINSQEIGYLDNQINMNQYYHCEVNDLQSNTPLKSDSVYLRFSDYEIYSVHINLALNTTITNGLEIALFNASVPNRWTWQSGPAQNRRLSRSPVQRAARAVNGPVLVGSDLYFLFSLLYQISNMNSTIKFSIKPQLFLREERKLVLYFYKSFDLGFNITNQTESLLANATKDITTRFKLLQGRLPQFDTDTVQVLSIDWCWSRIIDDPVTNLKFILPQSPVGFIWTSPQICAQDRKPLAMVKCEGDKILGLYWGRFQVNPLCNYSASVGVRSNLTAVLKNLSQENITNDNVGWVLETTKTLIANLSSQTVIGEDLAYLADILQKSTTDVDRLSKVDVENIMDSAAKLRNFPTSVLKESQEIANATNRVLKSIDQAGSLIESSESGTNPQLVISGGLGFVVSDISRTMRNTKDLIVGLKLMADGSTQMLAEENLVSLFSDDSMNYNKLLAAIILPRALIESYNASTVRLAMHAYQDLTLYEASETSQVNNRTLNSRVIAAKLLVDGKEISDLHHHRVKTYFLPTRLLKPELRSNLTACSYWDYKANAGKGNWSSDGCDFEATIEGRDICTCDHLTNFAILMNFYDQDVLVNEHQLALSIISIIGLSLSIAGLSLTILSFIFIKSLHHSRPQQTLFQLSLALLCSWIIFLAGIKQTTSYGGCIVVAVLLHYFILASFMWMLMEGILQYLLFVKVLNTYFSNYILKTSLPAWGLPLIPVIILLIIDRELYKGGNEYCWLSLPAFYYGFIIPVGLIIFTNIILFIIVVISLCRRRDMSKYSSVKQNQMLVNIRASFICFCVLGLTWIFGFLTINDARIAFQYLFCIFNSLQGFIIFMMMTIRDRNVRAYWKSKLSFCCPSLNKRGVNSESPATEAMTNTKQVKCKSSDSTASTNMTSDSDQHKQEIQSPYQFDVIPPDY
ncbi:uncharacterized protein LOC106073017 isoform X2 [Biomphalaria glabrata]|uniref:Uncharacterized protein LOC106073017 isoform X2 n=1 Tax=Biomphalaria glabrata TaxID=6526 RepID=A0A9W2Z321_BIOGL|nr:uncharacterized protein LOC106073017 isoform X2 [Biomphalaria glabrata]